MKALFTSLLFASLAMTTSAQNAPQQVDIKKNLYKGKIGLSHIRNLSDNQLQMMGEHTGALPMPKKAQAAKMIAKARKTNAKAKAAKTVSIEERLSAANYAATDTLLWESVETWQGEFNWRPSNWAHFSNFDKDTYISQAEDECPTWSAFEGDGYYTPYATDGNFMFLCLYGSEKYGVDGTTIVAPAPEQDEWIVSSTVNNIQATNFLSFDLAYSPIYSHYFVENDQPTVDMNRLAYDVEVLVTTSTRSATNNEANYTKVFKLSEIVDEMMNNMDLEAEGTMTELMAMHWHHYKISLEQFAGKNIRVAFRYKGCKGGAVLLDAIRVSDMLPVALFSRPDGSFYWGFSTDARVNYTKNILMPAYTETTWRNCSNQDSETFIWRYNVDGESGTSNRYDLKLPGAKPGTMAWPTLQANAGMRADEYKGQSIVSGQNGVISSENGNSKIGGDAVISYLMDGMPVNVDFALGNFDPTKLFWLGEISNSNNVYAFGSGSGSFWAEMTHGAYADVRGIANVFERPAAPYVFNRVTLPMGAFFNLGATIVCTIYEAKETTDGGLEITDKVLGEATTVDGTQISGGYMLTFNFPNVMIVDTPICIKISGFDNTNLLECAPLTQAKNHDNNVGYSFVILKNIQTGGEWWAEIAGALSAVEGSGNMEVSHCIGMNAVFPYMHSNDGDIFESFTTGEVKTFDMDSYWYPRKLDANDQLNGWTIIASEPWVKAELSFTEGDDHAGVTISTEALPSDMAGRYAYVTVKALGCEETILVKQGEVEVSDAIDNVWGDSPFGKFNGTFNLAGQKVNSNREYKGITIEKKGNRFIKVVK